MKHKILKFLFLFTLFVVSQELPPINTFTPENYNAGNQNWMISQDVNNNIYVANNEGLLTYNGSNWKLYNSPNKTIMRSVKAIDKRIYTGCFMEFGYWKKNEHNNLTYKSLTSLLQEKMLENEEIWNIINFNNLVVFQSFSNLYIYNFKTNKINVFSSTNQILKLFKVNEDLFFQEFNDAIFKFENGKAKLFSDDPILKNSKIINIFKNNDDLLFVTDTNGIYKYQNLKFEKWNLKNLLKDVTVYSAIKLKDKFAFGTISKGIIIIDNVGNLAYEINQRNGLNNNTVLSLFSDLNSNLWLGLDNGINLLNLESPITIYNDYNGIIGTVYCSIVYRDYLYLGTNQGLFYKKNGSKDSFRLIKGTKGQVWSLVAYKDELFCGHNLGVFLVNNHNINLIHAVLGTWNIKPIPKTEDTLLLGSYNGLYIIKKINGNWQLKNKITGFDISSRFFEFGKNSNIWINHEYKGVYRLALNTTFTKVDSILLETTVKKGKNSSITKYNNQLLYASEEGVFSYNNTKENFVKDRILSKILNSNYISGKLIVDKEKLWTFSKNSISYISPSKLTNSLNIKTIPISSKVKKGMVGFENITAIDKNTYLLGTSNGYLKINALNINDTNYDIIINNVFLKNRNSTITDLAITNSLKLKNSKNSIGFNFSVPAYNTYILTEYQHKLIGLDNNWTDWNSESSVLFKNLKHNDYTFIVRAKVGNVITNQKELKFTIQKPWHLSNTAYFIYFLIGLVIIFLIHRVYKWYFNKLNKNKQLTNEQLIMRIKNEKLNQDIDSKNRELAISTMSIIKKNKVLSSIKKELTNNMTTHEIKSVIRLIDKNLNTEKDWKFFEEAFNNADKDFLNKLKNAHPNLTPNDLRFCAYLRLNLSSKEIAPLLNISVRSIEIKRYRLRKKMNLKHADSLVKHILNI